KGLRRLTAGPVAQVDASAGQRLGDLLRGLVGKASGPGSDGHVAAVVGEIGHSAVIEQHRDAILVEAVRVGAGHRTAPSDPVAILVDQHIVEYMRAFGGPAVAKEDV